MARGHGLGLWILCAALMPARLCGQGFGAPGDTLRYTEATDAETIVRFPQGPTPIETEHDAQISVAVIRADSLHAWYDFVTVATRTPTDERRPDLSELLRVPFVLGVDRGGRVVTRSTPTFPTSLSGITDLRYQFADFFVRIPGPLRTGLTWTDTVTVEQNAAEGTRGRTRKIVRFGVVADSLIFNTPAFTIRGEGMLETSSEGPVAEQPGLTMRIQLSGPAQEEVWVRREPSVLIGRRRSASLTGTLTYLGIANPVTLEVSQSYDGQIFPRE